jgi:hypothetical protein
VDEAETGRGSLVAGLIAMLAVAMVVGCGSSEGREPVTEQQARTLGLDFARALLGNASDADVARLSERSADGVSANMRRKQPRNQFRVTSIDDAGQAECHEALPSSSSYCVAVHIRGARRVYQAANENHPAQYVYPVSRNGGLVNDVRFAGGVIPAPSP